MVRSTLSLAALLACALAPAPAVAFSHGDVPNVASDKRAHEPPEHRVKEAEHEGGVYHRPAGQKKSWWDNQGHVQHANVYTSHSSAGRSGSSGPKVQHLAGGATVSDAPSKGHGRRPASP